MITSMIFYIEDSDAELEWEFQQKYLTSWEADMLECKRAGYRDSEICYMFNLNLDELDSIYENIEEKLSELY